LMRSYFVDDPIIHEKNMFSSIFEWESNSSKPFCECVMK
jgi:hypothetical protein